jgi:hypothetical protein
MNRWKWVLLILELALFALILVLPQVDLPDFTFHRGTAPVAAKARLSAVGAYSNTVAVAVTLSLPTQALQPRFERVVEPPPPVADSRLALLCTLLC